MADYYSERVGEMSNWIKCSDKLPPIGEHVLLTVEFMRNDWRTKVGAIDPETGMWWTPGASWTPSHWQPLPEHPVDD